MGKPLEETVHLLQDVEAVGVWGNHDVGLCFEPGETVGPVKNLVSGTRFG